MRLRLLALSFLLASLGSPDALGGEKPDLTMLNIYDNFILSDVAAERCLTPDDETKTSFGVNFLEVMIRASIRLKELKPSLSHREAQEIMKRRYGDMRKSTIRYIEKFGCDSEEVGRFIKLYEVHANWDMHSYMKKPKENSK